MITSIIVASFITFLATFILTAFMQHYLFDSGMIATDMNKKGKPKIPTSGGVAVVFGFLIGVMSYVFAATYLLKAHLDLIEVFGATTSILLGGLIGFLDDIHIKAKKEVTTGIKDTKVGLKQWQKLILTFIIPIPFMVVQVKNSTIWLPFLGVVNVGILYPLIILPLAIIFMANAVNMLAGLNGLEAGLGCVASLGIGIFSLLYGRAEGTLIAFILFASLLAFLFFNKYPAKILPGDSLTYMEGVALASAVILGNIEKFGVVVFIPWLIEFILKARSKMKASSLGKIRNDGTLAAPYGKKIYSLTHLAMNIKKVKEWEAALYIILLEVFFVFLGFALEALGFFY
jgi:UDP-N-acetylglucosamine--dolichyl-phosphate N-acetylglucosaminephosphotransferase